MRSNHIDCTATARHKAEGSFGSKHFVKRTKACEAKSIKQTAAPEPAVKTSASIAHRDVCDGVAHEAAQVDHSAQRKLRPNEHSAQQDADELSERTKFRQTGTEYAKKWVQSQRLQQTPCCVVDIAKCSFCISPLLRSKSNQVWRWAVRGMIELCLRPDRS